MHEVRLGKIPTLTWSCFARSTKVICKTWVGQTNSASQSQFVLRTIVSSPLSVRSYEEGPEVEFGFTQLDWLAQPLDAGTVGVLRDGFQIVYDRSGKYSALDLQL